MDFPSYFMDAPSRGERQLVAGGAAAGGLAAGAVGLRGGVAGAEALGAHRAAALQDAHLDRGRRLAVEHDAVDALLAGIERAPHQLGLPLDGAVAARPAIAGQGDSDLAGAGRSVGRDFDAICPRGPRARAVESDPVGRAATNGGASAAAGIVSTREAVAPRRHQHRHRGYEKNWLHA